MDDTDRYRSPCL